MTLTARASAFLVGVGVWTALIWVVLIRNIAKDHGPGHGAAFHTVHYTLAAIVLALDAGVVWLGARGLRAAAQTRRNSSARLTS